MNIPNFQTDAVPYRNAAAYQSFVAASEAVVRAQVTQGDGFESTPQFEQYTYGSVTPKTFDLHITDGNGNEAANADRGGLPGRMFTVKRFEDGTLRIHDLSFESNVRPSETEQHTGLTVWPNGTITEFDTRALESNMWETKNLDLNPAYPSSNPHNLH